MSFRCVLLAVLTLSMCVLDAASRQAQRANITVFAASDLGPAFKLLAPQYERKSGAKVTLVLGSTGTLTQQIRNGAPADVFFAANETYIHQLAAESLILEHTRSLYARGRITLVALKGSRGRIEGLPDLANSAVKRVAIANPAHAPYGLAAKQALEASGLWAAVAPKLVYGENVQQAVQYVRSGSAQAGIVARSVSDTSDLQWHLVDERLHSPIDQSAAVLVRSRHPEASAGFIAFVNADGRSVMRQFGFLLPGESF